jgi:hypothetical protein
MYHPRLKSVAAFLDEMKLHTHGSEQAQQAQQALSATHGGLI